MQQEKVYAKNPAAKHCFFVLRWAANRFLCSVLLQNKN